MSIEGLETIGLDCLVLIHVLIMDIELILLQCLVDVLRGRSEVVAETKKESARDNKEKKE